MAVDKSNSKIFRLQFCTYVLFILRFDLSILDFRNTWTCLRHDQQKSFENLWHQNVCFGWSRWNVIERVQRPNLRCLQTLELKHPGKYKYTFESVDLPLVFLLLVCITLIRYPSLSWYDLIQENRFLSVTFFSVYY